MILERIAWVISIILDGINYDCMDYGYNNMHSGAGKTERPLIIKANGNKGFQLSPWLQDQIDDWGPGNRATFHNVDSNPYTPKFSEELGAQMYHRVLELQALGETKAQIHSEILEERISALADLDKAHNNWSNDKPWTPHKQNLYKNAYNSALNRYIYINTLVLHIHKYHSN